MNFAHKISAQRSAALAALLVAVVMASGCGKAMPTSPLVDPGATSVQNQTSAISSAIRESGAGGEPGTGDGGNPHVIGSNPDGTPDGTDLGGLGQGQGQGQGGGKRHHRHRKHHH